jgi:TrmH family RNA methyltransferase
MRYTEKLARRSITSSVNPLLKEIRRAVDRGSLTADGYCVAETRHLLNEALRSGCEVKAVLSDSPQAGARTTLVAPSLLQSVASTETCPGVITLVKPPVWSPAQLFRSTPLVVVLDGIQDPGNAGTIVRSAEAFGATGVIFLKGSVSPHNPKTLRASAGSLFRVPTLHGVEAGTALDLARQHDAQIYAATSRGGLPLDETDLTAGTAIVIGSEAHGVGAELSSAARAISIPTTGVESLNAAIAAGILLYEARRQRSART